MQQLQHTAAYGRDGNERGLAALEYAIALRNSFGYCWALTRYWDGSCIETLDYEDLYLSWFVDHENYFTLDFIYRYDTDDSHAVEHRYDRQVAEALGMMTDDEVRAAAHLMLYRPDYVIKHYGYTRAAMQVRRSCDNWRDWL